MRARWLFPFTFVLLMILAVPPLRALAAADAGGFMSDVSSRVLQLITDKIQPDGQREERFAALVDETFDIPRITRFVLGQNWRSASEPERADFAKAFRVYMTQVYWGRFKQYNGQSFTVTGQEAQSATLTLVHTRIVQPSNQPPINVDWAVAKAGDDYKIVDVSIEGVSLALTYRQDFGAVIERNDGRVAALIAELNKKIKG